MCYCFIIACVLLFYPNEYMSFYHVQMNTYSSKIKDLCIFKVALCQTVLKSGYIWFLFPVVFSNIVLEHIIDSILIPTCLNIYYLILLDLSPRSAPIKVTEVQKAYMTNITS